jgi:hypothetical protein
MEATLFEGQVACKFGTVSRLENLGRESHTREGRANGGHWR